MLGSGDKSLEDAFVAAAEKYPKSIAVQIGYDEEQAHHISCWLKCDTGTITL